MNRRDWMRTAGLSMAAAVGLVAVTAAPARAEIHGHVKQWLNDRFGAGGWQDGGHFDEPVHYHAIVDPAGNPLGNVEEGGQLTWTFYPADGSDPVVIHK